MDKAIKDMVERMVDWQHVVARQSEKGQTSYVDARTGEIIPTIELRRGMEIPDPNPVAVPAGFKRPESIHEQVRRLVRAERLREDDALEETWDDANDFGVDDDFDPKSPWETVYDDKLGREVTIADYQKNLPQLKQELGVKLRNYQRAIAQAEAEEEFFRGAGVSPAQSSEAPKEPLAKPRKKVSDTEQ